MAIESVLDLPIERQRELAKLEGYSSIERWQEDTRNQFTENERLLAEAEAYKPTKAEIAEKIYHLRTNPYAIEFYRRITQDYDLTVEEQIKHLESLETAD
ncbi:hypothetical protein [Pelistega sp. MC2]|uniref:hypothetical protein n=1 Tax=Pelistega sp. MC2 TaxID=1720297 RepID=UPI0008DA6008|nr:hypothetical protein [Pelistega sp. MC2]